MNRRRRSLVLQSVSVGTPVLLVVVMRAFLLSSPSSASAASGTDVVAAVPPRAVPVPGRVSVTPLTPEQQRLVDWRKSLDFTAAFGSPMDTRIDVVLLPAKKRDQAVAPAVAPKVDPLEGLVLSGFMGNQIRGLVTISGKVYRVGDPVKPGLRVTSIDLRAGSVSLTTDDGTVFLLVKPE